MSAYADALSESAFNAFAAGRRDEAAANLDQWAISRG